MRDVAAGRPVPADRRDPMPVRAIHQRMVGGMELDLVDAAAPPVEAAQFRWEAVGLDGPGPRGFGSRFASQSRKCGLERLPALSRDGLAQRGILHE